MHINVRLHWVITLPVYPPLNVLAGGDATFCEGNSTLISATAGGGNGGPYLYSWNNDQINTNSATVFASNDSTFVVTVNDGCSPPVQDSVHLTIYPLPQVDFLPTTHFRDYSGKCRFSQLLCSGKWFSIFLESGRSDTFE
ncbi:MAG: hypothetical protein U0073_14955 [Bacteroidia bacterium]